jgi:hypothetical protein
MLHPTFQRRAPSVHNCTVRSDREPQKGTGHALEVEVNEDKDLAGGLSKANASDFSALSSVGFAVGDTDGYHLAPCG